MKKGQLAEHGRYIYAYCHIQTNQVLYSLTRSLNSHSALGQLPDVGANNKPAALRKDLWRPLFTLILPPGPHGTNQGLNAYKKLREYRKLHETNWQPSPLLSRPYNEDEIKEMQKKLDERGGKKKESVYDVIKRKKKQMRIHKVVDQKANSIADLAAVLLEQDALGAKTAVQRQHEMEKDRKREAEEMIRLAEEAEMDGMRRLTDSINELQHAISGERELRPNESLTKLKRRVHELEGKKLRMEFAVNAVANAKTPGSESTPSGAASDDFKGRLPAFPASSKQDIPKRGPLRAKLDRLKAPIFSTEGISIKWQNMLDAEYAETWPEAVQHHRMGWSRYTAPHAAAPSADELEAERDDEAHSRKAEAFAARTERKKHQRKVFVQGIQSEILRQIRERQVRPREATLAKLADLRSQAKAARAKQAQEKKEQAKQEELVV